MWDRWIVTRMVERRVTVVVQVPVGLEFGDTPEPVAKSAARNAVKAALGGVPREVVSRDRKPIVIERVI